MYPKRNGDEYYDTTSYKTDSSGDEIYATLKNGSQKYLQINELDIMAQKRNETGERVPYFAVDEFKHPICPRLERNIMYLELNIPYPRKFQSYPNNFQYIELYPKLNNKEYYIGKNGQCQYATNENQEEYYATNVNKMYYAFQRNTIGEFIEFPRVDKNAKEVYIVENDQFLYPFNLSNLQPKYPKDLRRNEYYLRLKNMDCFAIRNNKPFYAKNRNGHDIFPNDTKRKQYYIFYILDGKKYEVYPKRNKDQYYLDQNSLKIYAKKDNDEYYAKKENDDEYFADEHAIPYYAKNSDYVEVYPSNSRKDNFYKIIRKKEILALDKKTRQSFYAKDFAQNEFYPKSFEDERKPESPPKVKVKKNYEFIDPTLTDIITHEASVK